MNICLIGGGGYIGAVLARGLLNAGHTVLVLDNFLHGDTAGVACHLRQPGYAFRHHDVTQGLPDIPVIDAAVVLAGVIGDPAVKANPEAARAINDTAMKRMPKWLNGRVRKVVFISSCSVYGMQDDVATEESDLNPLSDYALHKAEAEEAFLSASVSYETAILRLGTVFGVSPRMRWDLTVNEFTRTAVLGRRLDVYDADTWRPYVHVQDVAAAILFALTRPLKHRIYNVAAENATKRDLAAMVGARHVNFTAAGPDPRDYRADSTRLRMEGFDHWWSLDRGIGQIAALLGRDDWPVGSWRERAKARIAG